MNYYYTKNGLEYGPISLEALRMEHIFPDTMMRHEHEQLYREARYIPEVCATMGWGGVNHSAQVDGGSPLSNNTPNVNQRTQNTTPASVGRAPKNYRFIGVICLLLGQVAFGVLSLGYSVLVDNAVATGWHDRAHEYAKKAKLYGIIGLALVFLGYGISAIVYFSEVFFDNLFNL